MSLKFSLIIFSIFLALPGFSQEETRKEPLTENGGQVIIRGTPDLSPSDAVPLQESTKQSDEETIQELERIRLEQIKKAEVLAATAKAIEESTTPLEQIRKLGYKQLDAAALMDKQVQDILKKTINDGALDKLTAEDVKKHIREKVKGSYAEKIFNSYPKLLDFSADFIRSKEALNGFIDMMGRKDDLKEYAYIWLGIFLIGLYIKHRIIKPKWNFLRRLKWSLFLNFMLMCVSLYVFMSYFGNEIAPTIDLFKKHFY